MGARPVGVCLEEACRNGRWTCDSIKVGGTRSGGAAGWLHGLSLHACSTVEVQ